MSYYDAWLEEPYQPAAFTGTATADYYGATVVFGIVNDDIEDIEVEFADDEARREFRREVIAPGPGDLMLDAMGCGALAPLMDRDPARAIALLSVFTHGREEELAQRLAEEGVIEPEGYCELEPYI